MKWFKAAAQEIVQDIEHSMEELNIEEVEKLIRLLLEAKKKKIFIVGMGRSGFVGRSFALRLMNLGFNVYFIGENITPAAEKEDLLIAISGTEAKKTVLTASAAAKEIGATVIAITSFPDSPLGDIVEHIVTVKGRTKMDWPREKHYLARQLIGERESLTPIGSIFENNCMVLLDSLIVELMHRLEQLKSI